MTAAETLRNRIAEAQRQRKANEALWLLNLALVARSSRLH